MPTYEVIAGAHGIDGKLLKVGARFEKGAGFEATEHFKRCFKKVNTDVEDRVKAEVAKVATKTLKEIAEAKASADTAATETKALAEAEAAEVNALAEEEATATKELAEKEAARVVLKKAEESGKEAAAQTAQIKALGWTEMGSYAYDSPEIKKYRRTVDGKRFFKTEYGKQIIEQYKKEAAAKRLLKIKHK